jgi:hypothetical protein
MYFITGRNNFKTNNIETIDTEMEILSTATKEIYYMDEIKFSISFMRFLKDNTNEFELHSFLKVEFANYAYNISDEFGKITELKYSESLNPIMSKEIVNQHVKKVFDQIKSKVKKNN